MIDWAFIESLEGASVRCGYVPDDGDAGDQGTEPGVTVGAGFDLGHRNRGDLEALGLPRRLIEKLEPYCDCTGSAAIDYLASNPLTLDDDDVREIDHAVRKRLTRCVEAHWNDVADFAWTDISDAQATVVMSVAWQYGSPWRRCPRFWACATSGNWPLVIAELREFGDRFPTRRNCEADYLEWVGAG